MTWYCKKKKKKGKDDIWFVLLRIWCINYNELLYMVTERESKL